MIELYATGKIEGVQPKAGGKVRVIVELEYNKEVWVNVGGLMQECDSVHVSVTGEERQNQLPFEPQEQQLPEMVPEGSPVAQAGTFPVGADARPEAVRPIPDGGLPRRGRARTNAAPATSVRGNRPDIGPDQGSGPVGGVTILSPAEHIAALAAREASRRPRGRP